MATDRICPVCGERYINSGAHWERCTGRKDAGAGIRLRTAQTGRSLKQGFYYCNGPGCAGQKFRKGGRCYCGRWRMPIPETWGEPGQQLEMPVKEHEHEPH